MFNTPQITAHAVQRYQERVDSSASRAEARLVLVRFALTARRRPTPRSWMRHRAIQPGTLFLYAAYCPDICLIMEGNAVLTVVTRELWRHARPRRHLHSVPPLPDPLKRWRWDGTVDEAA